VSLESDLSPAVRLFVSSLHAFLDDPEPMPAIPSRYQSLVNDFSMLSREEMEQAFGWLAGYSKRSNEALNEILDRRENAREGRGRQGRSVPGETGEVEDRATVTCRCGRDLQRPEEPLLCTGCGMPENNCSCEPSVETRTEWAFYLSNGSIERRLCDAATPQEANARFPFEKWYQKQGTWGVHSTTPTNGIKVLKTVQAGKEDRKEICPENPHAHHLGPLKFKCGWCRT